jgi:hypothetical protein
MVSPILAPPRFWRKIKRWQRSTVTKSDLPDLRRMSAVPTLLARDESPRMPPPTDLSKLAFMSLLQRRNRRPEHFDWTRYWLPRGGAVDDDGGYLVEPEAERFLGQANAHVRTLDELDDVPCLLLLGDPSIGKSHEIEDYVARLTERQAVESAGSTQTLHIIAHDITEFDNREQLRQAMFTNDVVDTWRRGEGLLYLILDSLDETLIEFGPLCDFVLDQFATLPLQRCRVRLACRTSELPMHFRQALERQFRVAYGWADRNAASDAAILEDDDDLDALSAALEEELSEDDGHATGEGPASGAANADTAIQPFATVELAVLTQAATRIAAATRLGSEAEAGRFLEAVKTADAQLFAARPLTLLALIERHRAGTTLAASQVELYREMCLRLSEQGTVRPGPVRAPQRTSAIDRYYLARRISAAMLLGNRRGLWLGAAVPRSETLLDLAQIAGDELLHDERIRAHELELREAVNTGLFTAVGDSGLSAHLSLAEFMTADWLASHELPLVQIMSLIADPSDPDRHVIPQLRHVSAWLASQRDDVLALVRKSDPDLLLWNDVVQLPPDKRPPLVAALLSAMEDNRLPNPPLGQRRPLSRLNHDGLAQQLIPIIGDHSALPRLRDLAIDIAAACDLVEAGPTAAAVALDTTAPLDLRVAAASLVAAVGVLDDRQRLVPLALASDAQDEADQMKGAVLRAVWTVLRPEQLFAALTPMRRPNFGGEYALALSRIADDLAPEHLLAGSRWLARSASHGIYFDDIGRRLFELAFRADDDSLDADAVRNLGIYARYQFERHDSLFGDRVSRRRRDEADPLLQALRTRPRLRHALLTAIVAAHGLPHGLYAVGRTVPDLFPGDDVPWAIDQLASLPNGDPRRIGWVEVIKHAIDVGNHDHLERAFAQRDDPDMAAITWQLTAQHATVPDAIASVAATRAQYRDQEVARSRREEKREAERVGKLAAAAVGPMVPRLEQALRIRGDTDTRWRAVAVQLLREDSGASSWSFTKVSLAALRDLAGSAIAPRVAQLAGDYLREATIPEELFPSDRIRLEVFFGFAAAAALRLLDSDAFLRLDAATLGRWLTAFVRRASYGVEQPLQVAFLERMAQVAPDRASDALLNAMNLGAGSPGAWINGSLVRVGLDIPRFRVTLLDVIASHEYTPNQTEYLLGEFLKSGFDEAVEVALELFQHRGRTPDGRAMALAAGSILLTRSPGPAWGPLWQRLTRSEVGARQLLEHAASNREGIPEAALGQLSDKQVADLHLRIATLYPPNSDVWHVGVFSPDARDNLSHWRSQLLRVLVSRKTNSAVDQLERIARARPETEWLARMWLEARASLRDERWGGTDPRELMRLVERGELRLIESGLDLVSLVVDSLARFQDDLRGELRAVVGLWNESLSGNTPKGEEHLANAIARHLRQDLRDRQVVIGRELILQIGVLGGAKGKRTDIDIVATGRPNTNRTAEKLRLVIEVKGSWNPSVLTAMKDQLVDRYLDPHRIQNGLFVVGRYDCPLWRKGAKRARSARLGSVDALSTTLSAQAAAVTNAIRLVGAMVLDTSLPARKSAKRTVAGSKAKRALRSTPTLKQRKERSASKIANRSRKPSRQPVVERRKPR